MRQTNVCLNRVFKILRKICIQGPTQTFVLMKKCAMKIERKIKNDGRFIRGDLDGDQGDET